MTNSNSTRLQASSTRVHFRRMHPRFHRGAIRSISHVLGFTLMEILVVIASIVIVVTVTYPIVLKVRARAHKTQALSTMANLGLAVRTYAVDHNGELPSEDVDGKDDWIATTRPEAENIWYNALPRAVQGKGVGDFVRERREAALYTKESALFIPGATYPQGKRMARPYFAVAINSKLQRRAVGGDKPVLKLSNIPHPSRTAIFFEKGLPGEPRAHETMSRQDYDGTAKGTAKSFVTRYGKKGVVTFVDGSAREFTAKELLQANGDIIWSSGQAQDDHSMILWSAEPKDNPNERTLP